jgi:ABC-2 type transport system permease protein
MSLRRMNAIAIKEFIQFGRDKTSVALAFGLPVFLIVIIGYAATFDVDHLKMAVCDMSCTTESRQLIAFFEQSEYFVPTYYTSSYAEVVDMIDRGKARVGMIIEPSYARDLRNGMSAQVQFLIDGQDPVVAKTALSTCQVLAIARSAQLNYERLGNTLNGGTGPFGTPYIDLRPRLLYNPEGKSSNLFVPGLIGLILQNILTMLTSFAMLRETERGNFEQLLITPIKPIEMVLGKLIPYVLIGLGEYLTILLIGIYWFKTKMVGDPLTMLVMCFFFILGSVGLGLLVSTIAKTQLQAIEIVICILLPSLVLSGFVFPLEAQPHLISLLGSSLPVTYFIEINRGIMIKGVGYTELVNEITILAVQSLIIILLATLRLKKQF